MNVKLSVKNLRKVINESVILENISFSVNQGEFLSILGPSGCGKSTILKLLIGLMEVTSGEIFKDGINITKMLPSKRNMGIVFQDYALFQNMTVLGNVEYALKIQKETKAIARQKALEIIEQLGLTEHISKKPAKLSGGQQQRVAIARTLAVNPEIILFDEPMSALDAENRLQFRHEIKDLQKTFNSTIIYITHDQEEALAMSDRIMVMQRGQISQLDTPENILCNPANTYVSSFVCENLKLKVNSLKRYIKYVEK